MILVLKWGLTSFYLWFAGDDGFGGAAQLPQPVHKPVLPAARHASGQDEACPHPGGEEENQAAHRLLPLLLTLPAQDWPGLQVDLLPNTNFLCLQFVN